MSMFSMSMLYFMLLLSTIVTATCIVEQEVEDDRPSRASSGISLLQKNVKTSPHHTLGADDVRPANPPAGLGPVALLHVPYTGSYDHIALNLTYSTFGEQVLTFPERRPREFNYILATIKTWTADAVVQFLDRRRGVAWSFDWRRSAAFAIFGFVYIGLMQWFLYVTFLTWLFPDAMIFANSPLSMKLNDWQGQIDMAGQVAVDILFFQVLIYFPCFYVIKAFVQGSPGTSIISRGLTGLSKYRSNVISDNLASCAIWIPADLFIFACPMYLRMPLEHGVSFGWTMFMSFTRGANEKKGDDKGEP